jgi:hypothetical protein
MRDYGYGGICQHGAFLSFKKSVAVVCDLLMRAVWPSFQSACSDVSFGHVTSMLSRTTGSGFCSFRKARPSSVAIHARQ